MIPPPPAKTPFADPLTAAFYDTHAAEIAAMHRPQQPTALYTAIRQHFLPDAATVDVGCGSGRDTAWLIQQGYPCRGVDGSAAMVAEAQSHFPTAPFAVDSLPSLATLETAHFANVLCSAVLMHLPLAAWPSALAGLHRVLRPDGVLLLSFRGTAEAGHREAGRLYVTPSPAALRQWGAEAGLRLQHQERHGDADRPLVWDCSVWRR